MAVLVSKEKPDSPAQPDGYGDPFPTITADATLIPARPGERVARRSLAIYAAIGRRLAGKGERA